ncbi:MAG: hypothetical protein GF334_07225 [Candidatus Altiarchaeales archaeon]|nr:hypothetical protein [Candidatus Altiarchaeales archaeon]
MPDPKRYKDEDSFMSDCIPQAKSEGKKQDQAVAMCLNMYRNRNKKKKSKAASVVIRFLEEKAE